MGNCLLYLPNMDCTSGRIKPDQTDYDILLSGWEIDMMERCDKEARLNKKPPGLSDYDGLDFLKKSDPIDIIR